MCSSDLAVCDYIVKEKGSQYAQGDVCIPAPVILQVDADDPGNVRVWGNFWVYNYTLDGTRLLTESGGEHPGILHLMQHMPQIAPYTIGKG